MGPNLTFQWIDIDSQTKVMRVFGGLLVRVHVFGEAEAAVAVQFVEMSDMYADKFIDMARGLPRDWDR